jgi:hypothetical protein
MQIDNFLIREDQLDSKLAMCVNDQRRADFSMLLAMLSQDVLDFSQFHLPEEEQQEKDNSEAALKKALQLGPEQILAPAKFDMLIGQHNAERLAHSSMASLRLSHCLNPEPLSVRDNCKHIPLVVVDNCELAVRNRLDVQKRVEGTADKPKMDASAMYDQLKSGEMQSALRLSA